MNLIATLVGDDAWKRIKGRVVICMVDFATFHSDSDKRRLEFIPDAGNVKIKVERDWWGGCWPPNDNHGNCKEKNVN